MPTKRVPFIAADGEASKVFKGPERVKFYFREAEEEVEALNVPSYKLEVLTERPALAPVHPEARVWVTNADVPAVDARGGRSRKLTFRCPGPLLDRLERHVPTEGKTNALAALAEFGLNVLIANDLYLTVTKAKHIGVESYTRAAKRYVRGDDTAMEDLDVIPESRPIADASRVSSPKRTRSTAKKAPAKKRR